jgi:hypothetical protein
MIRNAATEVRAMQAEERRRELRATGTDDHRPNVRPVRTGFEGQSMPVQTAFDSIPDEYVKFDFSQVAFAEQEVSPDDSADPYADVDLGDLKCDDDDAGCDGVNDLPPDRTDAEAGEDTLAEFDE